jgi:hypothetical protein
MHVSKSSIPNFLLLMWSYFNREQKPLLSHNLADSCRMSCTVLNDTPHNCGTLSCTHFSPGPDSPSAFRNLYILNTILQMWKTLCSLTADSLRTLTIAACTTHSVMLLQWAEDPTEHHMSRAALPGYAANSILHMLTTEQSHIPFQNSFNTSLMYSM